MADTIGDIIARGYKAGRAIGDDASSWRFERGARKVEQKYQQLAAQEGVGIETYMPQIEAEVDELYRSSGARKRGLTGNAGGTMGEDLISSIGNRATTASNRRAYDQASSGAIGDSRRIIADTQGRLGNYDTAISNRMAGEMIDTSSAAVGRGELRGDGTRGYDAAGAARGISSIHGRYGNAAGAAQADSQAQQFAAQTSSVYAGKIAMLMDNPIANADAIRGYFDALKQMVPDFLGNKDIEVDKTNGSIVLYTDGNASGSFDPGDEQQDLIKSLMSYTQDPGSYMSQLRETETANATHARERAEDLEDERTKALFKLYTDKGMPPESAREIQTKLVSATQASAAAGWKFGSPNDDGSRPATFNNRSYMLLPPTEGGDGPDGLRLASPWRLVDIETNTPVTAGTLSQLDGGAMQQQLAIQTEAMQATRGLHQEDLRFLTDLINNVGVPGGGNGQSRGSGARAQAPADAQGVQAQYEEIGSRHGFRTTSTTRSSDENERVGGVPTSQHLEGRGTARDWSVKGKSPEQIRAFVKDLEAAGYEVITQNHGTGPHIHAELPPGARRAAPSAERQQGIQTAQAAPPAAPAQAAPAAPAQSPLQVQSSGVPTRDQYLAISRGFQQEKEQIRAAEAKVQQWETALREFDAENPGRHVGMAGAGVAGIPVSRQQRDPRTEGTRRQIERALSDATNQRDSLIAQSRVNVAQYRSGRQQQGSSADFEAIKARLAGGQAPVQTAATNPAGNEALNRVLSQAFGGSR